MLFFILYVDTFVSYYDVFLLLLAVCVYVFDFVLFCDYVCCILFCLCCFSCVMFCIFIYVCVLWFLYLFVLFLLVFFAVYMFVCFDALFVYANIWILLFVCLFMCLLFLLFLLHVNYVFVWCFFPVYLPRPGRLPRQRALVGGALHHEGAGRRLGASRKK